MKVAFINQPWNKIVPPVKSGSIGILTYEIARRLATSCDVVIYGRKEGSHTKVAVHENIEHRHFLIARDFRLVSRIKGSYRVKRLLQLLRPVSPFRFVKTPLFASRFYFLGYILQVAADLRKQKCDVIHVHNLSQFTPIVRWFNPRARIVLHMTCEWLSQLDRKMIGRRVRAVDLILGCSEHVSNKIRKRFPQMADKCRTVYNGVNVGLFQAAGQETAENARPPLVLFVGRVSPEKGLHTLLDAHKRVVERNPDVQLSIVGPNAPTPERFIVALSDEPNVSALSSLYKRSYMAHLEDQVKDHELTKVEFTGSISYQEVNGYYQKADLFVCPSFSDAFPLTVLEAMASGLPVVASRVGGVPEAVVDEDTGLLVESDDPEALANAISRVLEDSEMRESMRVASLERAKELFSWDKIAEDLRRHYENLTANTSNHG